MATSLEPIAVAGRPPAPVGEQPAEVLPEASVPAPQRIFSESPGRSAWVEIDLRKLRRNFELINRDKPAGVQVLSVVKDEGYGHGALPVARTALECGAKFFALSTVQEALCLRDRGIQAKLLLLGD